MNDYTVSIKIATSLTNLLKQKNLSLRELSKKTGVPYTTLQEWTTNRAPRNPVQVQKVALILEVSLHELLFDQPDPFEAKSTELLREIFSGDVRVTLHKIEKRIK